jgi:hypothetical protein
VYWGLASVFAFAALYYVAVFYSCASTAGSFGEALTFHEKMLLIIWGKAVEISPLQTA